jgi:hypothetical protein
MNRFCFHNLLLWLYYIKIIDLGQLLKEQKKGFLQKMFV